MLSSSVKGMLIKTLTLLGSICLLSLAVIFPAQALFVSPPKDPMPLIKEIFVNQTHISEKMFAKEGAPLIWTVYGEKEGKGDKVLGYAFETNDLAKIPAYSGEPVNMLVATSMLTGSPE